MSTLRGIVTLVVLVLSACSSDDGPAPDGALSPDLALTADAAPDLGAPDVRVADLIAPDLAPPPVKDRLIILHTNDLHDHLMGFAPNTDYTPGTVGDDATLGGAARLAARVKLERQQAGGIPVLLLDGGDSLIGSLFTWLNPTHAPMFTVLQQVGFDGTTLGNHEFEWTTPRLAKTLQNAVQGGFKVPILASNLKLSATDPGDDGLAQLFASGVIQTKRVVTLPNGLRVGMIGLLGKKAASVAHGSAPVTFADPIAAATPLVTELRLVDKVDLVVVLSHSGIDETGVGEDRELAKAVPDIDVIISGHTHDTLVQPVKEGKTLIVQTGCYGRRLGRLSLKLDQTPPVLESYQLITLDDKSAGDGPVQQLVDGFIKDVDALLAPLGLAYAKVIAETGFKLTRATLAESTVGDLVTDAYRHGATAAEPGAPADLAFESNGVIRDEIVPGKTGQIWLADLYRVMPMGVSPDGSAGYPLASFYLTGKEIGLWLELLPLARLLNQKNIYFQFSGATVKYKIFGLPLNSIASATLTDSGQAIDLNDDTKCYKVVSNVMVSKELAQAGNYTVGLLTIEPKEQDCATKVTDLWQRVIDRDPATPGVQELKHWRSIVDYLAQMPDTDGDGVPNLPQVYSTTQGRFVAD